MTITRPLQYRCLDCSNILSDVTFRAGYLPKRCHDCTIIFNKKKMVEYGKVRHANKKCEQCQKPLDLTSSKHPRKKRFCDICGPERLRKANRIRVRNYYLVHGR